jgi:cyclopropane-fatty-acyl-phospholipid synthase
MLDALARFPLRRIRAGRLDILDRGRHHVFGPADSDLEVRVVVRSPRFWRSLMRGSTGLAKSYADEDWDCDDLVALARIGAREMPRLDRLRRPLAPLSSRIPRVRRNTREGSRRNVAAHYDLGNEFFSLFLDDTMAYSCAYFETPQATLFEAQEAKFERACAKLALGPDDHLLEIGTGWGWLPVHAASRYGCRVTATTTSREQHAAAVERVRAAGLEDRVTVLLADYRDLRGRFDKLVSIEMIEAVGWQYHETFLRRCSELLVPEGAMLLQAIVIDDRAFEVEKATRSFIKTLIFPGCCLPSVEVIRRCVGSTDMRELGVEYLSAQYPDTMRLWRERFLANSERIASLGYDRRFRRMWELYLAWCEGGFREGRIGDVQMLLAKPAHRLAPAAPVEELVRVGA